jgi:hypothetical protein
VKGICGYGRYDDDPEHVGCPRARSDMTPCIARDGSLALADRDDPLGQTCVGCGIDPWDALVEIKQAAKLTAPVRGMGAPHHAAQLRKVVRRETAPEAGRP